MAAAAETEEWKSAARASFTCQKCGHPLKLDESFDTARSRTLTDLAAAGAVIVDARQRRGSLSATDETVIGVPSIQQQQSADDDEVHRKVIKLPSRVASSESGNGFTLLGDSAPSHFENLSHRLKVTSSLFDILSEQSEVDHPLCEECTDTLLDLLDLELKATEDDCKEYREFMEQLESTDQDTDESALDAELEQLQLEESKLERQLESIESERDEIAKRMAVENTKSAELNAEEDRYFDAYNEYKRQLIECEDAQRSVDNQLKYAMTQLDKLKTTNVFNATFHIWHSGHFGTINNFRLGRLPSVPVEWNEINAAWGQTVLLLHSLGNKMKFKFQRFRLVPYGNHSFLESLADHSRELPLYGSGGFRFVWDTKFDQAMVAFLDCLQQFKDEVEVGDTSFCLPYKMDKGRIEDSSTGTLYSIKMQFNSEEQWTKALKFMLTNLKWGLAWVASQFANK